MQTIQLYLEQILTNNSVFAVILSGIVGLIPNCASSVVITQLYLTGLMSLGAMMAGLLVGSGVGLLVLFRTNRPMKQNIKIVGLLYVIGVVAGVAIDLLKITL